MSSIHKWPLFDATEQDIRAFRSEILQAPVRVRDGFDLAASRKLLGALIPTPKRRNASACEQADPDLAYPVLEALAPKLNKLLRDGADPSVQVMAVQGHFMPLSMASLMMLEDVADLLLKAGAMGSWPEREIDQVALTGGENIPYYGIFPDPLSMMALTVGRMAGEGAGSSKILAGLGMARRLAEHASPLQGDPATGLCPLEELITCLDYGEEMSAPTLSDISRLVWDWARPEMTDEDVLKMADGGERIPGSITPLPPALVAPLQGLARQELMEARLAPASPRRGMGSRL